MQYVQPHCDFGSIEQHPVRLQSWLWAYVVDVELQVSPIHDRQHQTQLVLSFERVCQGNLKTHHHIISPLNASPLLHILHRQVPMTSGIFKTVFIFIYVSFESVLEFLEAIQMNLLFRAASGFIKIFNQCKPPITVSSGNAYATIVQLTTNREFTFSKISFSFRAISSPLLFLIRFFSSFLHAYIFPVALT